MSSKNLLHWGASRRIKPMLGVVALAAAAALAGCSADSPEGSAPTPTSTVIAQHYAAAKSEGSVIWYTALDPARAQDVADSFNKAYPGVTVTVTRLVTGTLTSRYSTERAAGGTSTADVLTAGDPVFFSDGVTKGWFNKSPELANLSNWDSKYVTNGVTKTGFVPTGIAYNTDKIKTPPTKWTDLLAPSLAGRLEMGNPATVPSYMQLLSLLETTYGASFMTQLAAQKPTIVASAASGNDDVASGKADMMITTSLPAVNTTKATGAPIAFAAMSPTNGGEFFTGAATQAPHPNAALLFYDYILSPEGQAHFNQGQVSPLGTYPGTEALPAGYATILSADIKNQSTLLGYFGLK